MKKSRYAFRAKRARQLLTLMFQRTWAKATKHPLSEYRYDEEMWRLFRAQKGAARYWILRLRRLGLVDGWKLNRRGSMEFWRSLVREAAETVTDPEKNAAPVSEDLQRRADLINDVARHWGVSLTPKLREQMMGGHKYYRKEFGDKEGEVLLRMLDMGLGQIEREEENMKRIMWFPLFPL